LVYRGYKPGETFVGTLDPKIEARAVARGALEIVEAGEIRLDAMRATLPAGWVTSPEKEHL